MRRIVGVVTVHRPGGFAYTELSKTGIGVDRREVCAADSLILIRKRRDEKSQEKSPNSQPYRRASCWIRIRLSAAQTSRRSTPMPVFESSVYAKHPGVEQ